MEFFHRVSEHPVHAESQNVVMDRPIIGFELICLRATDTRQLIHYVLFQGVEVPDVSDGSGHRESREPELQKHNQ